MENKLIGKYAGIDTRKVLKEDYNKKYFVVTKCVDSYAEGITGTSYYCTVLTNDDKGFDNKKDAKILLSERKKELKTKITQKDRGYGSLGRFYTHSIMSNDELVNFMENNRYPIYSINFK